MSPFVVYSYNITSLAAAVKDNFLNEFLLFALAHKPLEQIGFIVIVTFTIVSHHKHCCLKAALFVANDDVKSCIYHIFFCDHTISNNFQVLFTLPLVEKPHLLWYAGLMR